VSATDQLPPGGTSRRVQPADNEAHVVAIAADVIKGKGLIDDDAEPPLEDLRRLYREIPECQVAVVHGEDAWLNLLADRPGEILARAWEAEREAEWQRYLAPRWQCPCGQTLAFIPGIQRPRFFTLSADELFDERVSDCPGCKRNIAETRAKEAAARAKQAASQLGLNI
jgi:hypothetical protein